MPESETMVRMGELAVSNVPGDVLVSLGLGSCIGLALLDRRTAVAGLVHVVLPQSEDREPANPRKFADLAVPALVAELERLGARRARLDAVLVGGASMFADAAAGLDVGQRNEAAVRRHLAALGIPVAAAATGGGRGRTVRVDVARSTVTVREAGGSDTVLLGALEVTA